MTEALLQITGKVQGVFYRAGCQEEAEKLGLTGYARNMSDGSVEVLLQGDKEQIEKFIDWATSGPERAIVNNIEVRWREASEHYEGFRIF